jgi:hypothetical protein
MIGVAAEKVLTLEERGLISDRTNAALAVRKAQGVRLCRPVTVPPPVEERIASKLAAVIAAATGDARKPAAARRR